jgi:ABC-2 type transport system permease protein
MSTERQGEVYDLGYQRYDGPREGRRRAQRAIFENGVRTVLGLGRGPKAKILPILLLVGAMLPAFIFIIILSLTGDGGADFIPGHGDYYQVIATILLIFSAIMAPELLVSDRRDNIIHLYLVRPLTATDYVLGRFLAFFVIVLALAYSGQILLLGGLLLTSSDPWQYLQDNWADIPRFLAAGVLVALFITIIPMAVASFINRRAYAAVVVIGLFFISSGVANGLTSHSETCHEITDQNGRGVSFECTQADEPVAGDAAKWFALISVGDVPTRINNMIFDREAGSPAEAAAAELHDSIPIGVYALFTVLPGFLMWWRYQRIRV